MKYGLVAVGVIAGCASQAPHRVVHVAAPKVLRAEALKVGQWATYVERQGGREVGRLYLGAVAVAECGTWVRARVANDSDGHTWMLCVRDDGSAPRQQLARAVLDDGETRRIDVANLGEHATEIDALLSRIVPPALGGAYAREDLVVDAGSFQQTLRVDNAGATTWLHPAVPFGGVVEIADGHGRQDVLYAVGDAGEDVERDFMAGAAARHRTEGTYELTGLVGWFSGTDRRPSDTGSGFSFAIAWPETRHFDLLGHVASLDTSALRMGWLGLGARYSPLRRDRGFATNQLFAQATLDFMTLRDTGQNTLGRGGGLSIGIGWAVYSRHDWTFVLTADEHFAYLNAGHGETTSYSAGGGIQLAFP